MGKIGTNIVRSREERAEDLLEYLYRIWREEETVTIEEYATRKKISKRETNALVRILATRGYVTENKKTGELYLTEMGKMEGVDCLERHEKLTQFFQIVGGMDQEDAQEDACRIEHVISQRALNGIERFLKYGDVYDRTYQGMDLYSLYGEGTFEMLMGIYQLERRKPRILAQEDEKFESTVLMQVEKGRSHFILKKKETEEIGILWYLKNEKWIQARCEENRYSIPADIFRYTTNVTMPVTEAEAIIAFTPFEQEVVTIDCREINIHVW